LTTSAATSPPSAMAQPAYTTGIRLRASRAQNAGRTSPAGTQAGGTTGPPGLSSSTDSGRRPAEASPGRWTPASARTAEAVLNRWNVHGMRTAAGTTAAMAALTGAARPTRGQAATKPIAATTAIGQMSGTNAA